jgi:two-component system OmpR family response regulator
MQAGSYAGAESADRYKVKINPVTGEPRTVIVADDDEDIRQLVVIAAKKAGVVVRAAVDNGTDAWKAVSGGGVDLAILDVSMPGMTGIEVADRIRADPALDGTRVLVVSASVQLLTDTEFEESRIVSADRFILKPFSPRDLTATIVDMLTDGIE